MNTLRTILSRVWMIDQTTFNASLPIVLKMMKGEPISFHPSNENSRPYALWQRQSFRYYNFNDAPRGSVAVHPILGTITKYDQECGPRGTESLMKAMARADQHANIAAHLLEIDSGGGEATNIETVARFIRNDIKKPVIAWFNGMAASAAYYIAAAADEIYASEATDMVGSIGTLISWLDLKAFYEAQGVKIHEVYADQSNLKNVIFHQAEEENYQPLKDNLLNPYAKAFISTVKEFRNISDEDAFKGKTYMTQQAISIGMIDGQLNWEGAALRAQELGKEFHNNNNQLEMNFQRIEAVLGTPLEIHNGGAFLNTSQLQQLDRAIVSEGHEAIETSALQGLTASINAMSTNIQSLQTGVSDNAAAIQQNADAIQAIGDAPGDTPTSIPKGEDEEAATPLQKEVRQIDATFAQAAKEGKNPYAR